MRAIVMLVFLPLAARGQTVSLSGAADSALAREVEAAARFELTRLEDQAHLRRFIGEGLLVRVPNSGRGFVIDYRIGGRATANRHLYRYARPYTRCFIERLADQYRRKFGGRLHVNSLVRTCRYQERLAHGNDNAVSCDQSSHVTGATVDIGYIGIPRRGRRWIEGVLLELERAGLVQATKERGQAVYHVMVYPTYAQARVCPVRGGAL